MVKKAAKYALWIAMATTIGGTILPRIIFRALPRETWPPVWKEAMLYFATGLIAAFSVLLLAFRIKGALQKSKQSSHQAAQSGLREPRPIFKNPQKANYTPRRLSKSHPHILCDIRFGYRRA